MLTLTRIPLASILSLLFSFAIYAQAPSATPGLEPTDGDLGPVTLGGKTVFNLKVGIAGWPARVRASSISDRLRRLADESSISPASIVARDTEVGTEIYAADHLVMLVLDADAQAEGRERSALAAEYRQKIRAAVEQYRIERSRRSILRGILFTILSTASLILLLVLGNKIYRRTTEAAIKRVERRIEVVRARSGDLINAHKVTSSLLALARFIRVVLVVVLLYTYLNIVLHLFAWTRPFADELANYVLVPLAIIGKATVAEIPNLFFVLVIAVITRYALKFIRALFAGIDRGTITISSFYPHWAMPTYRIVRILVLAFALVMAYPYIPGSDSDAFKGISIFLGVLVSLGSSSAVSNVVAGLTMVYMSSFRIGDRVKIGDVTGDVMQTRLQVTHLRTVKNEEIVIPNSKIINSEVINYSSLARQEGLILHTEVTIGYDVPWRQVHALLLLAAERTEGLLQNPPPFIRQKSLDDLYVTYELNVYTDRPQEMGQFYSELHMNIQDAFNEYDVQIMSPHYESDRAERPVVPRDKWYAAPAKPPDR